ncbi:NAD(P)H-dependent oxidoreductase [Vibrio sp. CAU 1672]|uniref:NAD(P)H-dependent oxidoreductase n=1 Tax=Vibrio sp. CAU 1672 TaxID=3032594 RepID=UPI0023DC6930|nr:NAD(P)H-dependent oxidoreductase [Vibrio sp. CAU 1672]MDF2154573.1 NAD(P)H-dependent oxidoreductase [Vibrio sp. CAU 1672]
MKRKILVILGHPNPESFCGALAQEYIIGAKMAGAEVREIRVGELNFDPVLWRGYSEVQELEPDLVECCKLILWAEHLVFVYPTWWGTMPSLMKGFIERTFLPEFAFKYREKSKFWDKLLAGRSAQLLVTMDTPPWYYRLIFRSPGHNEMKRSILGYCGIKVNAISEFSPIKYSTDKMRVKWLKEAKELGIRA